MSQCKNCVKYNHQDMWCNLIGDSPDPERDRDCLWYQARTNGDHFRAQTDEELAEWVCSHMSVENCEWRCPAKDICNHADNGMIKWLKQPYEGGGNDGKAD
jgi:hypothetical protein